jgi:hypothetical protein
MDIIITDVGEEDAFYEYRHLLIGKRAKALMLIPNGEWYRGVVIFERDPIPYDEELLRYPFYAIQYKEVS